MTIYYSLTFLLLAAEMVTFCVLVAPLPYTVRKKMLSFLSESTVVAKVAYALKISFIFVAVLFADSLQRMFRVTAEAELAKSNGGAAQAGGMSAETNMAARKFYSQRNTYLTGFCLFLSLVLTRTFYILLDLVHTQEEYAKLKKQGGSAEVADLQKKLEAKERDFEILKKQAGQQAGEFDRLATDYNDKTGQKSNKRKD